MGAPRYWIVQKLSQNQADLLESAETLQEAKLRREEMIVMFPGDYFILDVEESCFLIPFH
jgi:hypothetical protein